MVMAARAAHNGHLPVVDTLLTHGLSVNTWERGNNTYPMHWAAAAGHLNIVSRLADAGGDVVGRGDDHELEVIGWQPAGTDATTRHIAPSLIFWSVGVRATMSSPRSR